MHSFSTLGINLHEDKKTLIYNYFVLLTSLFFIYLSKEISFYNQGDFWRSIGFMLESPIELQEPNTHPYGFIWTYKDRLDTSIISYSSSTFYFYIFCTIQKVYSKYFDVFLMSFFSKTVVVLFCSAIAKKISEICTLGYLFRYLVFMLLTCTMFLSHNIGILNSFYQEYSFVVFFPALIYGLLCLNTRAGKAFICLGALFCGGSKLQYFYLPILIVCLYFINSYFSETRISKKLVYLLLLIQIVCFAPIFYNNYSNLNYYHSTFLGSYLVASADQLDSLGIDKEFLECVGVDAWGNHLSGPGGTLVDPGAKSCIDMKKISFNDIIYPYIKYPQMFYKLLKFAMPHHFTANYFNVYKKLQYIMPSDKINFHSGSILVYGTSLRQKLFQKFFSAIFIFCIIVTFHNFNHPNPLNFASLFLLFFILTQLVMCLVGEGIRDLSKHLLATQLALDLLILFCIFQLSLIFIRKTRLLLDINFYPKMFPPDHNSFRKTDYK